MNIAENTNNSNIQIKKPFGGAFDKIKEYTGRAATSIRSLNKTDVALISVITACAGSIIGCIFSKSFKKVLAILAALCGFGTAYLLYKKFADSEDDDE